MYSSLRDVLVVLWNEGAATDLALLAGVLTRNSPRSDAGHRPRRPESPNKDAPEACVIPLR
jgi:hypothetical protein